MEIRFYSPKNKTKPIDAHICLVSQDLAEKQLKSFPQAVKKTLKDKLFKGSKDEVFFIPYSPSQNTQHLLLVGLGNKQNITHQSIRHACGKAYSVLNQHKLKSALIDLSLSPLNDSDEMIKAIGEGFLLAHYKFNDLQQKTTSASVSEVLLLAKNFSGKKSKDQQSRSLKTAHVLSQATNFARWLGDNPGNCMTPSILAESVRKKVQGTSIKVTIWNKEKIKKEKMGGLLGVSLGSYQEPRFIIMEYSGARPSSKPVCFVGKGLTFDSGGISIKPSPNMDEMKFDMCGGAAVIGAMLAIAQMKLKLNVLALIPASENMPGANANKPGDVLRARNGKTMEVLNTDAEGRLILADALSYACEKKPQVIFDAATLTGAMVVALGNSHTGFFTRWKDLRTRIEKAAEKSGEPVWAMPLTDDHVHDIQSPVADVANIATMHPRCSGSAAAAAFLEHFVDKKIPWAHFDIAGTAWNVSKRLSYCQPKGASGVMVRTFYELACSYT